MIDVDDMVSKCRKSSRLLRWLRRAIALIFGLRLCVYRTLTCPKLGGEQNLELVEIWRSSGGFQPRRSWKLHALCFSFAFAPQNHSRQHRKTKVSELYLSDCHWAEFGDEMFRFAEFLKHFSGSLASCRDRPLPNNVRVQLAYQIIDVTRPQTHRVVCLCLC